MGDTRYISLGRSYETKAEEDMNCDMGNRRGEKRNRKLEIRVRKHKIGDRKYELRNRAYETQYIE